MPTIEQRLANIEARLARVEQTPKVRAYLDGAPRATTTMYAGAIPPTDPFAIPKSKEELDAEAAVEAARAAFEAAQRAWFKASQPDEPGRYLAPDGMGGRVVVDVVPAAIVSADTTLPEYQAVDAAERALARARVRLYGLQRRREQRRAEAERRANPPRNVPKPDGTVKRVWQRISS